jgi:hypothetical protein
MVLYMWELHIRFKNRSVVDLEMLITKETSISRFADHLLGLSGRVMSVYW